MIRLRLYFVLIHLCVLMLLARLRVYGFDVFPDMLTFDSLRSRNLQLENDLKLCMERENSLQQQLSAANAAIENKQQLIEQLQSNMRAQLSMARKDAAEMVASQVSLSALHLFGCSAFSLLLLCEVGVLLTFC